MPGTAVKDGWTLADAPRMDGKVAIVTGATGGLGYQTALGLARQGATTILAARNPGKGAHAVSRIRQAIPSANVEFALVDLANLASVSDFATAITQQHGGVIDILVNNAGVMGFPTRRQTRDGFEQQIGVNHLAHFALTAWLKDALCAAPGGGRVVTVASVAHRRAVLDFDDLQSQRSYVPRDVYARTKLATLIFALELHRRAQRNNWNLHSIAAHPGWARTDIVTNGIGDGAPGPKAWLMDKIFAAVAQSASDGALPSLYAATAPQAQDGAYYGPTGWRETRGAPGPAQIYPQAADPDAGARLWALSETLTGITFA
ncbi:oxidoreductase [Acidisphaera sp. S103]|uniref:oxidoreductase n=1 Tax=Acidisphaera sp. S103 TaxID=1747223 RepID=UPI001576239B|nr:oxidoreductase [Acidisphaera sp. S103]